jgi:hypothetical protein
MHDNVFDGGCTMQRIERTSRIMGKRLHYAKGIPDNWRLLLVVALIAAVVYLVISYLIVRHFSVPKLNEYVASYLYVHGANPV